MRNNFFTKELFIETMEAIKKQQNIDDRCTEAFQIILPTDFVSGYNNSFITHQLIKIVKLHLNDKSDMVDYFIHDLEWGKKYKRGMITEKNGSEIKIKTISDLWNYLTK